MADLDRRQFEILNKMGIDVWQRRRINLGEAEAPETGSVLDTGAPNQNQGSIEPGSDLDQIATNIAQCQRCELHTTRKNTVPGMGNNQADWMFVGEAPGQTEDEQGQPFVGRAGQLLDAMIRALQMKRADVFIANVIKCRPPGNRDPQPDEVGECEPFLHAQLDLIKPKIIVALGRISAQALLKTGESLGKLRGKVYQYGDLQTPLIVTYHPAYLLRSPGQKAKTWEDLLLAKSIAEEQT